MNMNLSFTNDIGDPNFGSCDIVFNNEDTITSSVLMSLFCFRRCKIEELQDGTDQNGWWVDTAKEKWGSKLWLLHRRSIKANLLPQIKQYCEESLKWLIDDGVCTSIDVQVRQHPQNFNAVQIQIQINRKKNNIVLQIDDLWTNFKQG